MVREKENERMWRMVEMVKWKKVSVGEEGEGIGVGKIELMGEDGGV